MRSVNIHKIEKLNADIISQINHKHIRNIITSTMSIMSSTVSQAEFVPQAKRADKYAKLIAANLTKGKIDDTTRVLPLVVSTSELLPLLQTLNDASASMPPKFLYAKKPVPIFIGEAGPEGWKVDSVETVAGVSIESIRSLTKDDNILFDNDAHGVPDITKFYGKDKPGVIKNYDNITVLDAIPVHMQAFMNAFAGPSGRVLTGIPNAMFFVVGEFTDTCIVETTGGNCMVVDPGHLLIAYLERANGNGNLVWNNVISAIAPGAVANNYQEM